MNKRIKKKHKWLGCKLAGANHCGNEIARHIRRKILCSGITTKPSYILNVRRYVRWFFHHSSEEEWIKRTGEACHTDPMFFSARHWLVMPADYTSFSGRYKPNPPLKDMMNELAEKLKSTLNEKEK